MNYGWWMMPALRSLDAGGVDGWWIMNRN